MHQLAMSGLLYAWTAAYAVLAALAIMVIMVGLRLIIVRFASGRGRLWADVIYALFALCLLSLLIYYS